MENIKTSYYDVSRFPALHELFTQWEVVRDELLTLDIPVMDIDRTNKTHEQMLEELNQYMASGNTYGWMKGWGADGGNTKWLQYAMIAFDQVIPFVDPKLSRTIDMLRKIDGIKVCIFSMLKAGASLPCHTHPEIDEEDLLQAHLPLVTAPTRNYSYLNVAGEFRQFVCGEPFVFDGSKDHFALNESDTDRVILYMEFSRRLLKN
jgi:beta-hydroxylase